MLSLIINEMFMIVILNRTSAEEVPMKIFPDKVSLPITVRFSLSLNGIFEGPSRNFWKLVRMKYIIILSGHNKFQEI